MYVLLQPRTSSLTGFGLQGGSLVHFDHVGQRSSIEHDLFGLPAIVGCSPSSDSEVREGDDAWNSSREENTYDSTSSCHDAQQVRTDTVQHLQ